LATEDNVQRSPKKEPYDLASLHRLFLRWNVSSERRASFRGMRIGRPFPTPFAKLRKRLVLADRERALGALYLVVGAILCPRRTGFGRGRLELSSSLRHCCDKHHVEREICKEAPKEPLGESAVPNPEQPATVFTPGFESVVGCGYQPRDGHQRF